MLSLTDLRVSLSVYSIMYTNITHYNLLNVNSVEYKSSVGSSLKWSAGAVCVCEL